MLHRWRDNVLLGTVTEYRNSHRSNQYLPRGFCDQGVTMVDTYVEGEPDPTPYKVVRVTQDGAFVSRVAEYATEAEAVSHKRRLDWHYRAYIGNRQLWPVKK